MLARLFGGSRHEEIASRLYGVIVARARSPVFYARLGVADSVDGRFDMISLHCFLVLHRLKETKGTGKLAQALFDFMFADMDRSLREMGVGDLSVGKRVKAMVAAFYGRVSAYQEGLESEPEALCEALARNLYRSSPPPPADLALMAAYVSACVTALAACETSDLTEKGTVVFATLPPDLT